MLQVNDLSAGYGDIIAVREFSFSVEAGKIRALVGANGAGKSSTIMCLMGLVEQKSGSIVMDNQQISNERIERRISAGLAIVPEGRRIFPDLNVRENLMVGGHIVSTSIMNSGIEMVYEFFPQLYERQTQAAGSLSGGEQQMLAMGRALISRPKILIVDELSLGLMPKVVDEFYEVLNKLKSESIGILLVEQNTERAFSVADDVSALEAGNLFWSGTAEQARANIFLKEQLMGVT
jgi:branched-chain amino acid transport system ATP-binding protein